MQFFRTQPELGKDEDFTKNEQQTPVNTGLDAKSDPLHDPYIPLYTSREMAMRSELSHKLGGEEVMLYRADYRLRSVDGGVIWVADSAVQLRDSDGNLLGSLGMLQDITDRRQVAESLQESEEKFKGLSEQSPNMIFINKRGRIVLQRWFQVSKSLCKVLRRWERYAR